ncbi:hypothetical protein [Salirhabdus salicampi]|uniref:hypothetical protein n=1 Tax=Salirhabdus salicampi TaxID=476102 RepID=UPI0020C4B047|nr:hypothetical protein [Salirhabdus salicampi]MCP8616693.1 hypothetical protein [Salirhabdus salicampi]
MKAFYFQNMDMYDDWNGWQQKTVYFMDGRFVPVQHIRSKSIKKIDTKERFIMTPGKVYVDVEYPLSDDRRRNHHVRRYLYQGCSLIISLLPIQTKRDYMIAYNQYVKSLRNLALDYMVAPKVHIRNLTPDMIRFFGIQKSPFICLEYNHMQDLKKIKWDWMRQMQALVQIPFATLTPPHDPLRVMLENDSFRLVDQPISSTPLMKNTLNATGISPKKGEISIYGDADFNLYMKSNCQKHSASNLYKQIPYISVIRGNVVKLQYNLQDQSMFGKHYVISIPKYK